MLTIKKRGCVILALAVVVSAALTACGPPGARELRRGEELIQSGNPTDAIPELKDAVEVLRGASPRVQATAWNLLGLAYHGAGQLETASHAYLEALKLDRNLWEADYNLGCLRLEQQNYTGAIDYFTTYITSHPKDMSGVLLLSRARLDFALGITGAERGRQLAAARMYYQYAEQLQSTAEACNALGLIELQSRNPRADSVNRAANYFKLALQRDPHYAPALLNLAIVSQRYLNDPRGALEAYQQYLAVQPTPTNAAEVQNIAHQLDLSLRISLVEQHPAAAPTNPVAVRQLPPPAERQASRPTSPALTKSAQTTEQPVAYQRPSPPPSRSPLPSSPPEQPVTTPTTVVSVPPAEPAPAPVTTTAPANVPSEESSSSGETEERKPSLIHKLNPLTWFSSRPKKSEPVEIPIPKEVTSGDRYTYPLPVLPIPGDRKLAEQLTSEGRMAARQSNHAQAMQDYEEAVKADPTYFDATLALGLTAIDAKEYSKALDALGQALNLQTDSPDARYAFAWTLGKRGYYQDAANELEKLIAEHPNEARARLLLGNFYAENLNEPKLAKAQYLKALGLLGPQSPQAAVIETWLDQHP